MGDGKGLSRTLPVIFLAIITVHLLMENMFNSQPGFVTGILDAFLAFGCERSGLGTAVKTNAGRPFLDWVPMGFLIGLGRGIYITLVGRICPLPLASGDKKLFKGVAARGGFHGE